MNKIQSCSIFMVGNPDLNAYNLALARNSGCCSQELLMTYSDENLAIGKNVCIKKLPPTGGSFYYCVSTLTFGFVLPQCLALHEVLHAVVL